jgi:hypothetical protein
MENQLTNKPENKTPNYLKRISTLEKEVKELKSRLDVLTIKMASILNALKRK